MADQLPPNLAEYLKVLNGAVVMLLTRDAEARAASLAQNDTNSRLTEAIATLQGHVEPIAGETGIATQLGDIAVVPALLDQLTAAMPPTA